MRSSFSSGRIRFLKVNSVTYLSGIRPTKWKVLSGAKKTYIHRPGYLKKWYNLMTIRSHFKSVGICALYLQLLKLRGRIRIQFIILMGIEKKKEGFWQSSGSVTFWYGFGWGPGSMIRTSDWLIRMRIRISTKIFSDFEDAKKIIFNNFNVLKNLI